MTAVNLQDVIQSAINPALAILPPAMDSVNARVMLLAIGLQESRFEHRRQIKGPARGFWQFEEGTARSRGGVWGVYLHTKSRMHLEALCKARGVVCAPSAIYAALEHDDVLAAGVARLLLWTDPAALPDPWKTEQAWRLYLRTWRPGKPHPHTWAELHAKACAACEQVDA